MSFKFEVFLNSLQVAVTYIGTTITVALVSLIIGLVLGLIIALVRFYKIPVLSQFLAASITVLKGVPIVLILLGTYLIFAKKFDVFASDIGWSLQFKDINPILIAIFGLSIMAMIGLSEAFRAAISSIGKGQYDAAKSLAMNRRQIIRRIMIPQALPVALPMMSNTLISLVKASSLVSMVGVVDIFAAAKISVQQSHRFLEAYLAVALIYSVLNTFIEQGSGMIERSLNSRFRREDA